jgi:tetratricopeptide (TPR) repeat protein
MKILSFLDRRRRKRAETLYDEARELLDSRLNDKALAIGRKLRKLRYSGAFEIEGLAYSGLDRNEDAVRVLREGLALAPDAWPNWLLLGSCLSNLGRYDEALLAYDRANACAGADRSAIDLNRAIVAMRREDYASVLRHLEGIYITDPDMRFRVIACRVTALRGLGRVAEAEDLGSRTLNEWRDTNDTAGKADAGDIALEVGEMRLERGEDRNVLRSFAIDWWRATRRQSLLWLIRELLPRRSGGSQYFRLMLHGTISPESGLAVDARGFYGSVDVVADSPEEALALLVEIDPPEAGVALTIEETTVREPRPEEPKGVYAVRGRAFYKEA